MIGLAKGYIVIESLAMRTGGKVFFANFGTLFASVPGLTSAIAYT
jgi:hypothetical protein